VPYMLCTLLLSYVCVFFFQAEDGIRDRNVTGVQACALPIFHLIRPSRTVGVPRRNVARTRPGRVMPRKGVLLLLVTMAGPSTSEIGRASCRGRVEGGGGEGGGGGEKVSTRMRAKRRRAHSRA